MKILIGIDESVFSKDAVQFVKAMRWPADARFIVLSAVQVGVAAYTVPGDAIGVGPFAEAMEDLTHLHREFTAHAEKELRAAGFETEARVLPGDPGEVLVRVAKDENVDLIVVGSHGRTGLTKFVLGSVANHVVTHAPCTVLVARTPAGKRAAPAAPRH
jgi:nucleotide-binding universal stress UspA family protein